MPSATCSTLEFSCIQATEVSKYRELRVQVSLDGTIQESQESSVNAGVHTWREPFSFDANSDSLCEIRVLVEKRRFFCCARRYKTIRKTRLQSVGELLDTRSSNGEVQLPLYDSSRMDGNGIVVGNVTFLIADMSFAKGSLIHSPTRESNFSRVSRTGTLPAPSLEVVHLETLPSVKSGLDTCGGASVRHPQPISLTSLPPPSPSHCLPCPPPQSPPPSVPSPDIPTPQLLAVPPIAFTSQPTFQLPQRTTVTSPPKSGVDRPPSEIESHGDLELTISPGRSPDQGAVADPLLNCDGEAPQLAPRGPAGIGNFTPILCEPPEAIASEGPALPELSLSLHENAPVLLEVSGPITLPQVSITSAGSSRSGSPRVPSCESASSLKRPNVHVITGSAQALNVGSTLSPGRATEPSPCSRSAVSASPQPTTSTSSNSALGLSPFTQSPAGTDVTTPSVQSSASERAKCAKQERKRPTIDTSCVGPRGQVRKYRNGSVPPVHVPVKLRNASLDLPRHDEYERFEPNPSLYSIAPSISPRHFRTDTRFPSSQPPASRQGFVPSSRAPSVRREPLEYDEGQICLDTANLGDQEVATFLKEVDAALSAIVHGSSAVASDGLAFLTVPNANRGLASRQSRRPSSQQLRADLSATVRSGDDKEGAARTGFSLVATSHPSPHPDPMPSRFNQGPLSDGMPRLFVSQVEMTLNKCPSRPELAPIHPESTTMTFSSGPVIYIENSDEKEASRLIPGSKPASPSRGMIRLPSFTAPQRVSRQSSLRQELAVGWSPPALVSSASSRAQESAARPLVNFSDHNNVTGNEMVQ
ncbi:hypothetical protein F5I97DRAFT_2005837 [Phlebopus sp. FC_14]|nr:hypothetical protein F5I97DRAFT_2005837 [Phlebopus sp. FC_14]